MLLSIIRTISWSQNGRFNISRCEVIKLFLFRESDGGLDTYGNFIETIIKRICDIRGIRNCPIV